MASKKHVAAAAAAAYTFLELQNMYSARLVCHADSSSPFRLNCAIWFCMTPLILKIVKMQIDIAVM